MVNLCFPGTPSRIGGAGFADLEQELREQARAAETPSRWLKPGGLLKAVPDGEYHMYNPAVVGALQAAVRSGDRSLYQRYADAVNGRAPSTLRDLLQVFERQREGPALARLQTLVGQ